MPEVKMRFNLETEEVELLVDDKIALSSGRDVFESWVRAYNDKHEPEVETPSAEDVAEAVAEEPEPTVEEPVEDKVVEVTPETPVSED